MTGRVLFAAILAGILAGIVVSGIHFAKVVPLILAAETYEGGAPHSHDADTPAHAHAHEPAGGLERNLLTFVANLITGMGFALVLAAAILVSGRAVSARSGAVWGAAGFFVVSLAPAFGHPPELPGMPAADLYARQIWWAATVAATAAGGWLIVFNRVTALKAAGIVLIVLPHLVGAPHLDDHASDVPAGLASAFAAASLGAAAVFWLVLGTATGWLLGRDGALRPT